MKTASINWTVPLGVWKNEPAFILGGGPSLKGFDPTPLRGKGRIFAVNESGLTMAPYADVLFWADVRWYDWNKDRLHLHTGEYKITRKRVYNRPPIDTEIKYIKFLPNRLSHWKDSIGGWCGGSSTLNLAYLMGCDPIFLLGFDMRDEPLETWREGNWHQRHVEPPVIGQRRDRFIPALENMATHFDKIRLRIFNCNPNSALRCFPFVSIDEVIAMDNLTAIEREKYCAVWQRREYRKISPGILDLDRAWLVCSMSKGESLIDYGSGPARATYEFQRRGLRVTAVDIAPNARETEVPFVEACLWDLPDSLEGSDWAYCCDVLEHIPPMKVDEVLAGIARRTIKGAYFRIATRPDKMGPRLLKRPLHLTVQNADWWRRKVEQHWPLVDVVHSDARDVMLFARPIQ